jgi:hypothetical protein
MFVGGKLEQFLGPRRSAALGGALICGGVLLASFGEFMRLETVLLGLFCLFGEWRMGCFLIRVVGGAGG